MANGWRYIIFSVISPFPSHILHIADINRNAAIGGLIGSKLFRRFIVIYSCPILCSRSLTCMGNVGGRRGRNVTVGDKCDGLVVGICIEGNASIPAWISRQETQFSGAFLLTIDCARAFMVVFQEVLMLVKYVHELQALQQKGMLDDRPVPTESTMSRSQYASGIVGGGASTLDMARSTLTKPRSAASGSSTTTATQATALKAGWKLPTREHAETLSRSEIVSEFKKLDITGEGRLTFLTLKTALEIRDVQIDDTVIRGWLRTYDLGDKGYVDFSDFEMIYRDAAMNTASTRAATAGAGTGAGSRLFATTNEGRSLSASRRYSDHNFDDRTRQAQQQFASSLRSSNADFQQQLER